MTATSLHHETLQLERVYLASPERVFAAWSDPVARARWTAPNDGSAVQFESFNFKTGGHEISHCGAPSDLRYRVDTRYLDIVENQRILFSETVSEAGELMGAALITVQISPHETGTRLVLTDQALSVGHRGYIDGSREGFTAVLENLAKEVE